MTVMSYLERLPQNLRRAAYYSEREAAWPRAQALEVIDAITEQGGAILGGEIWLATEPGPTIPTPFIYTWETEQRASEGWPQFVQRANEAARQYVVTFAWDDDDGAHHGAEPYFNLTVLEEEERDE